MSEKVKVTVNLPQETVDKLRRLAALKSVTMSDAIRQAIMSDAFLTDEENAGGTILIEKPDRTYQKIVRHY